VIAAHDPGRPGQRVWLLLHGLALLDADPVIEPMSTVGRPDR
jgi:hypothetical protein